MANVPQKKVSLDKIATIQKVMSIQERMPSGVFKTKHEAFRNIGIKTNGESSYSFYATTK